MDKRKFFVDFILIILVLCVQHSVASVDGEAFDEDDDESPTWNRCPWIRNKLKNGRVKIRSRGRIAKFLCDPGFELAGKRFATCVRGQWNNPIPVCVSRGCFRPPAVANARVSEMYRGAVLLYECLPGYTMYGGATVYCDGRQWSSEAPRCDVATADPPLSCDFENPDLCGWSHDPTHDFDWKRNQFSTPSGHVGTGPSYDHTFGQGKGGFYLYMEASSPRKVNDTARLFSPVYQKGTSGGCFVFWYHMFGETTGGLRVYVKPESHVFGELSPTWVTFGDQGNQWLRGNVSVPQFHENFQIVIEGIRGSSYIGDTAIDDVSLNTEDCTLIGNSTDHISESVSNSCRGRCREVNDSYACGCNDDCVTTGLGIVCCEDFLAICTKGPETEGTENPEEHLLPLTTLLPVKEKTSPKPGLAPTTNDQSIFSTPDSAASTTSLPTTLKVIGTPSPIQSTDIATSSTSRPTIVLLTTTSAPITKTSITLNTRPTKASTTTSTLSTSSTTSIFSTTSTTSTITTTPSTTSTKPSTTSTTTSTTPLTTSTTPSTTSTTPSTTSTMSSTTSTMSSTTSTMSSTTSTTPSTTSTTPSTTSTTPSTTSTTPSTPFTTLSTTSSSPFAPSTTSPTTFTMPPTTSIVSSTTYITSTIAATPFRNRLSSTGMSSSSVTLTTSSPSSTLSLVTIPLIPLSPVPNNNNNMSTKANIRFVTLPPTPSLKTEETRRTYNLRPRYKTTPRFTTTATKSTTRTYFPRPSSTTKYARFIYLPTSSTRSVSTLKSYSTGYLSTKPSSTRKIIFSTTVKPLVPEETAHSSKSASTPAIGSQSTATIVCVLLVAVVCIAGGLVFYIRRWKARKQSKLADDSEMRFLSENEVMEYSDPTALDRVNFNHQPLI